MLSAGRLGQAQQPVPVLAVVRHVGPLAERLQIAGQPADLTLGELGHQRAAAAHRGRRVPDELGSGIDPQRRRLDRAEELGGRIDLLELEADVLLRRLAVLLVLLTDVRHRLGQLVDPGLHVDQELHDERHAGDEDRGADRQERLALGRPVEGQ